LLGDSLIGDSFELLSLLKRLSLYKNFKDEWWWPNSGTFEVVVGAILTQNSSWERVEVALNALRSAKLLSLEAISKTTPEILEERINSVAFYRKKSKVLITLSQNILDKFGSFKRFQEEVDREWLLAQRGVGFESCDSILNYGCFRKVFVVDNYTQKLVKEFGFEFFDYLELQEWMEEGLRGKTLFEGFSKAKEYAISHAMIVEFCKKNKKGSKIDITLLQNLRDHI
jgi:endonuclease-3 related protein